MFIKSVALLAVIAFASVNAGILKTHAIANVGITKVGVAKVGTVVHSVPSAVSHQSITQVHHKTHVTDIVVPVVKKVHVVPIVKVVPVVKKVEVVKTVKVAPVVKVVPVVKTVVVKPVHVAPVVHEVHPAPAVQAEKWQWQ